MKVRLQEWAKQNSISRSTAYRLYHTGKLPYPVERVSERIILIDVPDKVDTRKIVVYARVSTKKQVESLSTQKLRVLEYAAMNNIAINEIVEEIGSGLNENRKKLNQLLSDPSVGVIVVEHRERLTRINFRLIESTLKAQGREIIVIDNTEVEDNIVRDMTEVLTSFCARLYGRRGAKNRAQKAITEITNTREDNVTNTI